MGVFLQILDVGRSNKKPSKPNNMGNKNLHLHGLIIILYKWAPITLPKTAINRMNHPKNAKMANVTRQLPGNQTWASW